MRDLISTGCPTLRANLSLVFAVTIVGYDDDGERVQLFDTEDVLVKRAYFIERVAGCDGVDEKESLACARVLLAHSTAGSVGLAFGAHEQTLQHTHILPDRRCPEHRAAPLRHQLRIAFGRYLSAVVERWSQCYGGTHPR